MMHHTMIPTCRPQTLQLPFDPWPLSYWAVYILQNINAERRVRSDVWKKKSRDYRNLDIGDVCATKSLTR